ncbi:U3 small nucleolar RNA-associated protein 11 [Annulohypoxylon maeteangense]|uniref:U3 small nucleolar RNA-associated protein 11 n=1 Tax=Annulohypoxylon maeteangense TaxID=1927788 RepID=UPI002008254E|nr:U3 small nucleolar RNA-associated protein 11 [Annulohypoxylon maeteangense]KAI0882268.1 U3 small nucleolar RNA-associated protein 11 [Annulohypoxylon maeteangense]
MSSIRNAVQRRVHRERAQPKERQRLGLLEKHKDYSLRAKDFNKKKAQLRALRQKASDRNEDEFYFGMMSRKGPGHALSQGKRWSGTVNGDRGNKAMDMDTVRLLKTQDVGYIRTVRSAALKEVKGLEERVIGLGGSLDEEDWEGFDDDDEELGFGAPKATKAKKIVFTGDVEEREEILQQNEDEDMDVEEDESAEKNPEKLRAEQRQKLLEKLQRRLQNARKKLKVLTRTEHELELQRTRMSKTATSMNGITKSGKKFKVRERKR